MMSKFPGTKGKLISLSKLILKTNETGSHGRAKT